LTGGATPCPPWLLLFRGGVVRLAWGWVPVQVDQRVGFRAVRSGVAARLRPVFFLVRHDVLLVSPTSAQAVSRIPGSGARVPVGLECSGRSVGYRSSR
jgi:hypothetical protein